MKVECVTCYMSFRFSDPKRNLRIPNGIYLTRPNMGGKLHREPVRVREIRLSEAPVEEQVRNRSINVLRMGKMHTVSYARGAKSPPNGHATIPYKALHCVLGDK
jgi:hypothetical protein